MKRVLNMTAVVAGLLALGMGCDAGDDRPAEDTDEAGTASTGSSDPSDGDSTSGETDPQGSTTGSDTGDTTGGEETDGGDDGGDTDDGTTGGEVPAEAGMLFSLGNDADQNAVVAYRRSPDGSLERLGEFATGGMGTGSGLGSQSSLALADDDVLYVVNAGDDTVSSMRLYDDHLALVDIAASGGVRPTSVTLAGDRLYVLNADGAGSIAGFDLEEGRLTPIAAASRPLSGHEGPAPAQIGATPSGDYLIVTERATNQILAYDQRLRGANALRVRLHDGRSVHRQ
jgi:hypothetical protein